jgi:hypothetical protein
MLKLLNFMDLAIGLVLVATASLFGPYSSLLVLRRGLFLRMAALQFDEIGIVLAL